MKHCNSCGNTKEKSQFGKRTTANDGLASKCRRCQSEYDKSRLHKPSRVAAREAYAKTDAGVKSVKKAKIKWAANNKDKVYEVLKAYREHYPKIQKAHAKVAYEIKKGVLTAKPCEVCGCSKRNHAHHDDYDRQLDIRWLCDLHHKEWHKINGEGLNAS